LTERLSGIGQAFLAFGQNHGRFREILEALPAAIYTTDAAGRITFYNEAAATMWGRRPELGDEQWCGSWKLYWPDGTALAHDECPMAVALRTGQPVRGVETLAERPDGTRVPFAPYPTPIFDASSGELVGAVNMLVDLTHRKQLEENAREQQRLLLAEIMHRVKNTLTTVQAIAAQTLRRAPADEREAFTTRLHALSKAHDLLTSDTWDRASLRAVLMAALEPFQQQRFVLDGPDVWLNASKSLQMALAVHELATNAVEYGALSVPAGRVHVGWELADDQRLKLRWAEDGGPPVTPPKQKGFGTILIEHTFERARLDFGPLGFASTFEIAL